MVKIDIEMPIYCYDCPCHNGENGRCNITGNSTFDKRPFNCPLKEERIGKWRSELVKREDWKGKEHIAANVHEVKRGKWLLEREPNGKPYCFHCSVCDSDFSRISIISATPFCPWCGAEMDLSEFEPKYKK